MLINTFLCGMDKTVIINLAFYLKSYYTTPCTGSGFKVSISVKILFATANG